MDEEDGRPGARGPPIRPPWTPPPDAPSTPCASLFRCPNAFIWEIRASSASTIISRRTPMKTYQGSEIRNVAVVGHAHSGKTTLIAALLHAAKMTPTQGRVEDGSAATAYDEEEVARGITMQNAVAFAEWQGIEDQFCRHARLPHVHPRSPRRALSRRIRHRRRQCPERRRARHRAGLEISPKKPTCPASSSSTRWTTPRPAAAAD